MNNEKASAARGGYARRRLVKRLAVLLVAYVGLVVAFESFVVFMGRRQAAHGVQPGENWLLITTTDAEGSRSAVVAGVEVDGQLYVAANHWPRGWYYRVVRNPDVEVTRRGKSMACRAVPVTGGERARVSQEYTLPWLLRFLTGFPPRSFLRLSPR